MTVSGECVVEMVRYQKIQNLTYSVLLSIKCHAVCDSVGFKGVILVKCRFHSHLGLFIYSISIE